jgi:hypothetical protein
MGIYLNIKTGSRTYSTLEACHYGMESIFEHNPSADLHHKKVIKDLKDHHFKIDEISLVKVKDGLHCDVVAKDAKGFRSYAVTLEKNAKFPHLYRVFDVRGQKIVSKYQWREVR